MAACSSLFSSQLKRTTKGWRDSSAQWLRAVFLQGIQLHFPEPTCWLTATSNSSPKDPTPTSNLQRHQTCMWCSSIQTGNTHTHKTKTKLNELRNQDKHVKEIFFWNCRINKSIKKSIIVSVKEILSYSQNLTNQEYSVLHQGLYFLTCITDFIKRKNANKIVVT